MGLILERVTEFSWVFLGFTGFYWVLLFFLEILFDFGRRYRVFLDFSGIYLVLHGFIGF